MTYNALVYADHHPDPIYHLAQVPDTWAQRIDVEFPDGRSVVFIYHETPSNEERRQLMWDLQRASGQDGSRVITVDTDGTRREAPPLPP